MCSLTCIKTLPLALDLQLDSWRIAMGSRFSATPMQGIEVGSRPSAVLFGVSSVWTDFWNSSAFHSLGNILSYYKL